MYLCNIGHSAEPSDCFEDAFSIPSLAYPILLETHPFLIDLNRDSKERIIQDGKAALAELVMRVAHLRDFCKILEKFPEIGCLLETSPYSKDVIWYIKYRVW